MSRKSPALSLEDIFKTKDEEVKAFSELLARDDYERLASGDADKVLAPRLLTQESPGIRIEHGFHGSDYIWHVSAHHPRRPWKVPIHRVIFTIAKTLNEHIPSSVSVDITPPAMEWEIKEITVKAHKIGDCWNVQDSHLKAATHDLFKFLGSLI